MSPILGLILVAILVLLVIDSLNTREQATRLASQQCRQLGWQFLDGTAALSSMRLVWTEQRLVWRRRYSFDYVDEDIRRRRGIIIMLNGQLEHFILKQNSKTDAEPKTDAG
ncbi:MAG TPA: DUF3301 domain-containing protein [Gammaproteobacteria bacterium]|nr:DUF3301 domain-containing protein [Gammaproteobacteria bacterium]